MFGVKFESFDDKMRVCCNRRKLKRLKVYINDDYTMVKQKIRRKIIERFKIKKNRGKDVQIIMENNKITLIIYGGTGMITKKY